MDEFQKYCAVLKKNHARSKKPTEKESYNL